MMSNSVDLDEMLHSSLFADIPFMGCLFDLILYVPVNNFSVMSGRVFLG